MKGKWRFRLQRTFFGLTAEYMQNVYEHFFYLQYTGGWSFIEAYNLPVGLRTWFVNRLAKQIKSENDQYNNSSSTSGATGPRKRTYSIDELSEIPGLGEGLSRKR